MKVGEYVRNQYGIAKVINKINNGTYDIVTLDKPICYLVDRKTGKIKKENPFTNVLALTDEIEINKIKHSSNIIDLIEEGDYVNGREVRKVYDFLGIGKCFYFKNEYGRNYDKTYKIKSIVTKEQMKEMEYKI